MAAGAGHLSGMYHAQLAFRNSNGYPMGNLRTPNAPTNGSEYHAYKLTGPVSVTAPSPTREIATFRGGMNILGQRGLGTSDFGTFDMTLSAFDEVLESYISGAVYDTSNYGTANVAGAPNTLNANLPQFFLILTAGYQTSEGTNRFMHWIYNNVQIYPALASVTQDGGVNPNALTYTVVPSTSTRTISGMLYSASSMAVQDNKDLVMRLRTDNPIGVTTYIDDASETTFLLGYRPTNSENAGAVNIITTNGATTHANVSGIDTTTGVVTKTAATAADVWVVVYETAFVAI